MKRLHTQVSKADILRLLAVSRNAPAAVAAKMIGYPVEQQDRQPLKKKQKKSEKTGETGKDKEEEQEITRSALRVHAQDKQDKMAPLEPVPQKVPHEAFWYLAEKRALKKTLHRLAVLHACQEIKSPNEKRRILPTALLNIDPLSKEELAVPTFIPRESNESPPSPCSLVISVQSNKRPIAQAQPNQDRFLDNLVASTAESLSVPCNKRRQIRRKKTEQTVRRKKQAAKKNALRIRRLLGLLSVAAYIDPFLLQETVRLIPSFPSAGSVRTGATDIFTGIAIENALRSHPDVEQDSKMLLALKSEKKEMYYQFFAQEDEHIQTDMLALLRQRDAAHSPLLFALELLPVLPFVESPVLQKQLIGWLESFILRLVRTWFDQFDHQILVQHAEQLLQLIKMLPQKCKRQITAHSFLYGILHNNKLRSGAIVSSEYDSERVIQTVQRAMWPVRYQVIQQGEKLFLYPSSEASSPHLPGSPLVEFELSVDCLLVDRKGKKATLPVQSGMLVHDCTDHCTDEKEVYIQTPTEQFVFTACFRPSWAKTIGRHKKGLFVDTSWLGITHRLLWTNSTGEGAGQWNGGGPLQTDHYGLFVDLKITERVTQRFRQITPGWFMMGSPKDEPERESWGKESLHEVILTKKIWVADTAVTQELWQAIMGNNPSFFSGIHRPIEQVSYQDAMLFLEHLNKRIPGIRARLLTEAEWEYCCRAGSATPFCFGNRITPDQVNYNGQHPYHTGLVGKNRRQSVPVRSFPCNAWGLFEMHGNVWEWCQDYWQEDLFSQEPQVDPTGSKKGEFRVVRGGSWFLGGRGVRSAVRGKFAPHFSNSRIGFRIALAPQEVSSRKGLDA